MFGIAPDRHWYDEILANESSLCDEALSTIADAIRELGIGTIVTDAVEYFSPMHDLCNAIACAIVRAAAADGASIALLDYVNERPDLNRDSPDCFSQPPTLIAEWASDRESGPEPS